MKIVVASGKGGVGKSMLASSLALLFSKNKKIVACDCDVDAPNLGLWLGITDYDEKEKISTSEKAEIIDQKSFGWQHPGSV
ncbi:MAG: P-loop NTPase [Candidatus Aenigmarchaeota archaeon]|nr:P-loop NTPase [Candidatus Aenigmarchaeota archaeon]